MAYRSRYAQPLPSRPNRLRIFLPSLTLLALGLLLCGFWFYARWTVGREIEAWIVREAAAGRAWSCPERSIAGFPFRIEVSCANPTFTGQAQGRPIQGSLGRILAVAQIYQPRLVIVEADGPLTLTDPTVGQRWLAQWQTLRASVQTVAGKGLERVSLVATAPTLDGANATGAIALRSAAADLHLRRTPNRPPEDGAYDVAIGLAKAVIPPLDTLLRSPDPVDFDATLTVTRAEPATGQGWPAEIERWRAEGGKLDLTKLILTKGGKRIDAAGTVALDAARRPEGRLDLTLAGLDELLQGLGVGNRTAAIGGLLAGVLGGGRPAPGSDPTAPPGPKGVKLPLRFDNGRVMLGPLPIAPLPPLY